MVDHPPLPDAGSSLFSEALLVVRQEAELVDSTPVYAILDQNGARVGSVADVGRRELGAAFFRPARYVDPAAPPIYSRVRGLMAVVKGVSSMVREATLRLEVRNAGGVAVLVLTSAEFWDERSLITVARGDGATIGTITRQDPLWGFGKPRYALEAGGRRVGTIVADRHFTVGSRTATVDHHALDPQGREVARIAPRRHGWLARTLAREPPSFAVRISLPLPDPLHSLLLAGALTADTALKRQEPSSTTTGS